MDDYPPGYSKVAAIEDLDGDFVLFRRFGWLRKYALLILQDELVELETDLHNFDNWEFASGDKRKLISRRDDQALSRNNADNASGEDCTSERKELVDQIHAKLEQYGKLCKSHSQPSIDCPSDNALIRMQNIQLMKQPTERSQRNVHNLITNSKSLVATELAWIRHRPDLVAPGWSDEYGWLNTFFENILGAISKAITLVSIAISHQFPQARKNFLYSCYICPRLSCLRSTSI